jgi:glycerophosphoryl diester phosphodiesterase
MPENTLEGFYYALDLGVNTLEMDAVISMDSLVLLSHEPFLSHEFCLSPTDSVITPEREQSYNLYRMAYDEIAACDCGSLPHPRFPGQKKFRAVKPLLSKVIDSVESYARHRSLPLPHYNIETKCQPASDGIFHPDPETFTRLLIADIRKGGIMDRTTLQSFDIRTLQIARRLEPKLKLVLLVENQDSPQVNLERLGFTPAVYSPEHVLVTPALVAFCRETGMKLIPWTVNEPADIEKMLKLQVDGIISDYPDRVLAQLGRGKGITSR